MTATIQSLPREIVDKILTFSASVSTSQKILWYALVTPLRTDFLLRALYDSVTLNTAEQVKDFVDCQAHDGYSTSSLSIPINISGTILYALHDRLENQRIKALTLTATGGWDRPEQAYFPQWLLNSDVFSSTPYFHFTMFASKAESQVFPTPLLY